MSELVFCFVVVWAANIADFEVKMFTTLETCQTVQRSSEGPMRSIFGMTLDRGVSECYGRPR